MSAIASELKDGHLTQAEVLRQMLFHLYVHQIQKRLKLKHKNDIYTINLKKYKWDTEHYLKSGIQNTTVYLSTTLYIYTKVHLHNRTIAYHPKRGVLCP